MVLWELEAAPSLQQTHNAWCCNGWAVLKASACPRWSGAGRFPRAGLMQRQLQSAAVNRVNTLALPQLPTLSGRLNSCLGLAGAGLQPKARATSLPAFRLSISFAFPKVAVRIPSLQLPPATQYLSSASSKVSLCLPKHPALCFIARSPSVSSGIPAWPRAAAGGPRAPQHRPPPAAMVVPTQARAGGCAGGLAARSSLQAELGGLTSFQGLVNRQRDDGEAEKAGKKLSQFSTNREK